MIILYCLVIASFFVVCAQFSYGNNMFLACLHQNLTLGKLTLGKCRQACLACLARQLKSDSNKVFYFCKTNCLKGC